MLALLEFDKVYLKILWVARQVYVDTRAADRLPILPSMDPMLLE